MFLYGDYTNYVQHDYAMIRGISLISWVYLNNYSLVNNVMQCTLFIILHVGVSISVNIEKTQVIS